MGKLEFESKCKKEGHKPVIMMRNGDVNVEDEEIMLRCSVCDATCNVKCKWDNPIE